jgi:hypothetical protein
MCSGVEACTGQELTQEKGHTSSRPSLSHTRLEDHAPHRSVALTHQSTRQPARGVAVTDAQLQGATTFQVSVSQEATHVHPIRHHRTQQVATYATLRGSHSRQYQ